MDGHRRAFHDLEESLLDTFAADVSLTFDAAVLPGEFVRFIDIHDPCAV